MNEGGKDDEETMLLSPLLLILPADACVALSGVTPAQTSSPTFQMMCPLKCCRQSGVAHLHQFTAGRDRGGVTRRARTGESKEVVVKNWVRQRRKATKPDRQPQSEPLEHLGVMLVQLAPSQLLHCQPPLLDRCFPLCCHRRQRLCRRRSLALKPLPQLLWCHLGFGLLLLLACQLLRLSLWRLLWRRGGLPGHRHAAVALALSQEAQIAASSGIQGLVLAFLQTAATAFAGGGGTPVGRLCKPTTTSLRQPPQRPVFTITCNSYSWAAGWQKLSVERDVDAASTNQQSVPVCWC